MTDCPQCVELRRLLTQAEEAQAELATQLAGRDHQLRKAGADYITVKRKLDRLEQGEPADPDVEPHVERLLKLWAELHRADRKRAPDIDLDGPRAAQVRRMLKKFSRKAPKGSDKRTKFVYAAERLENAIRGCTLHDWAMGRIRKSGGKSFNDIEEHILASVQSVEDNEELWLNREVASSAPVALQGKTELKPVNALPEYAEQKVKTYAVMIGRDFKVRDRIKTVKGWSLSTLQQLEVGWDGVARRFTFPIRDKDGRLVNVVRYLPNVPEGTRKSIAMKDCPRDLFPAPETIPRCESCKGWGCLQCPEGPDVWLVEGEPDAITGWEMGLPTVSVPGTGGWKPAWGERFAMPGRKVAIVADCDSEGRASAQRIASSLLDMTAHVKVIDLDPSRDDKFDLGDAFMAGVTADDLRKLAAEAPVVQAIREAA